MESAKTFVHPLPTLCRAPLPARSTYEQSSLTKAYVCAFYVFHLLSSGLLLHADPQPGLYQEQTSTREDGTRLHKLTSCVFSLSASSGSTVGKEPRRLPLSHPTRTTGKCLSLKTAFTRIIIYTGHREMGLVLAGHYFLKKF